ncbi:MFS transporter [Roseateles sp. LKC17W]|uniref:MFS transporter n=1 Tax=Pelomonas margarita TaxID=3299031 RepID=A0ABW7FJL0_9BURK
MTRTTRPAPLYVSTMLAYGAGMLGTQIFRDTPAALLPLFMATMLGVPAWLTGIVVLVPKLWLVVCDPLMGNWSDKAKARRGRSPFLIAGAVLTSLGFVSLFSFTGFSSPYVAAVAIGVLYFMASTAFSAFSVPYLAMASELSPDSYERTKILSYRMIFAVLGVVIAVGAAQPVIQHLGGGPDAWRTAALMLGGLSLLSMLTTPLGLRSRVAPDTRAISAGNWRDGLAAGWRNRAYRQILSAHFIQSTAMGCGYTVLGFVFIYVVGKIDLILPFVLLMAAGSLISQPLWLAMSHRLGKRFCFVLATVAWALITVSWMWAGTGGEVLATLPLLGALDTHQALVILRGIGIGVTNAGVLLMIFSMLTDAIKDGQAADGVVDEGLLSGVFTAIEKLGFAIGPLIAGVVLSLSGFQSSSTGMVQQSAGAISGILIAFAIVPTVGLVLSLVAYTLLRQPQAGRLGRTVSA